MTHTPVELRALLLNATPGQAVVAIYNAAIAKDGLLDLAERTLKAEAERDEANHLCDAQSNLLANINDTLRVRGYEGQFQTDERVIALAQDRDAAVARATAAEERVKKLEEALRKTQREVTHLYGTYGDEFNLVQRERLGELIESNEALLP